LLLGHRGARRAAPENSLSAFELALLHGCDGFEFDLRRSADGRCICCHDENFRKKQIAANSYEALQAALKEKKRVQHGLLPSLDDVISKFGGRAFLDIELKVPGIETCVADAVKNLPTESYVVSSFLPQILQIIRRDAPSVPLGFIFDRNERRRDWESLPCEAVIPHFKLATSKLVEEIHAAEKKVFVWTVNQKREMQRFAEMGVDGIISDNTELLSRTFHVRRQVVRRS